MSILLKQNLDKILTSTFYLVSVGPESPPVLWSLLLQQKMHMMAFFSVRQIIYPLHGKHRTPSKVLNGQHGSIWQVQRTIPQHIPSVSCFIHIVGQNPHWRLKRIQPMICLSLSGLKQQQSTIFPEIIFWAFVWKRFMD